MSTHIEWADITHGSAELIEPGEIEDAYGSTNDRPALYIGECVLEGTPDQWVAFATNLLQSAQDYQKKEQTK